MKKPNVVCIIVDDTDFSLIGCYDSRMHTPNIDSIAGDGVRFDNAYCSSSICTPSRYSYLTGHFAGRCTDAEFLAENPVADPYKIAWNIYLHESIPSLGSVMRQNGKGSCMQSGVRIPLLMKWPGVIQPGTLCKGVVQNIDAVPSLLDCCNIPIPGTMTIDGRSFMPLLRGDTASIHEDLFFEFGYTRAVLWEDWKYIALRYPRNLVEQMKSGLLKEAPNHINRRMQHQMNINIAHYPAYFDPDQLYNIKTDPDELINLADDPHYRDILNSMKQRLKAYCDTFDHPFDLESEQIEFLSSEQFRALVQETKKIGTDYIPWWPKPESFY